MTAKAFFERLYLVLGPRQFAPFVTIPYASTPPPIRLQLFLDFPCLFAQFCSRGGPNFLIRQQTGWSLHPHGVTRVLFQGAFLSRRRRCRCRRRVFWCGRRRPFSPRGFQFRRAPCWLCRGGISSLHVPGQMTQECCWGFYGGWWGWNVSCRWGGAS